MDLWLILLVSLGLLGFLFWKYHYENSKPLNNSVETIEEAFIPSSSFQGRKQNYVFKLDTQGLGYYKDNLKNKNP